MTIAYPIGYPIASHRVDPNRPRIARPVPSRPPVFVVLHASYLTIRDPHPVDNPRRPAVPDAACNAFGEIDGWAR